MKKKGKVIISIIAILTAVVGAAVAVAAYLRRKAGKIREELDFDPNIYLEDEDFDDGEQYEPYNVEISESDEQDEEEIDDIKQN